ncbi:MAG: DUF5916 domain-containing protein, partial [Bacteroidota bacterium]
WDAVWESQVQILADGWQVELKIPYSAIRFPNMEAQNWNINFARMVRRNREQSFWNEVRPDMAGILQQSGQLSGIQDIEAPLRLSFTPYLSAYLNKHSDKENAIDSWNTSITGGMDLKYGINDAFTLDMTLIPDFGQVQADDEILNLSPFEIKFDENRPFFTEGTELFNKGDLFYSRRIGGRPIYYHQVSNELGEEEEIVDNPITSPLFNASKISGRTSNGLGIGLFNASSKATYAQIENLYTGESRQIQTNPLTNYNVLVLDQNLPNNSYVSLINTNVLRSGHSYDANASGALFKINNKKNTYSLFGSGKLSQQYYSGVETHSGQDSVGLGHQYSLGWEKNGGRFQYGTSYELTSRHYDIDDLGFLRRSNQQIFNGHLSYNIFKPFGMFNRFSAYASTRYTRLESPNRYADFGTYLSVTLVTRGFIGFRLWSWIEPFDSYDYFEPRTQDFSAFYRYPRNAMFGVYLSTDYRKRLAVDVAGSFRNFDEEGRRRLQLEVKPRIRLNDKLLVVLKIENEQLFNDMGYVTAREEGIGFQSVSSSDILFSKRRQSVFDNTIEANYTFNNKMSLSLRLRHYWTKLQYNSFHLLDEEGGMAATDYQGSNKSGTSVHDISWNIFTANLTYRWRFAPGSDLFVVWKNAIRTADSNMDTHYFRDLSRLWSASQSNNLSFRFIYYLDYLQLRKNAQ